MTIIHFATFEDRCVGPVIGVVRASKAELLQDGVLHEKLAANVLSQLLAGQARDAYDGVHLTYMDAQGMPLRYEVFELHLPAGASARVSVYLTDGTRLFRSQATPARDVAVMDLANFFAA